MNLPRFAVTHQAIVISFLVVAITIGLFNVATMSRREDPELTIRDALVVTRWPGALPRIGEDSFAKTFLSDDQPVSIIGEESFGE